MLRQKPAVYLLSFLLLGGGTGLWGCEEVPRGDLIPEFETLSNSQFQSFQRLEDVGVKSIRISPDGQMIVSGGDDDTVKIWDLETGELQKTLWGHDGPVQSVDISPDGQTIASGSWDNTIKLWDLATGELQQTLTGHNNNVMSIAISPDGETLASGTSDITGGSGDNTIKLWDLATGELQQTLSLGTAQSDSVTHLAIHPDGQTLISSDYSGVIKIWNLTTGELQQTLTGYPDSIRSFEISPDGQTLVVGHSELIAPPWMRRDNTIVVWNLTTGELQEVLSVLEPNSDLAVAGENANDAESIWWDRPPTRRDRDDDLSKRWWDNAAGALQRPLGYETSVYSVAISPDGQTLVTGGGEMQLWDLATGDLQETLPGNHIFGNVSAVEFSPDGQTLVSGDASSLKIWRKF